MSSGAFLLKDVNLDVGLVRLEICDIPQFEINVANSEGPLVQTVIPPRPLLIEMQQVVQIKMETTTTACRNVKVSVTYPRNALHPGAESTAHEIVIAVGELASTGPISVDIPVFATRKAFDRSFVLHVVTSYVTDDGIAFFPDALIPLRYVYFA